MDCSRLAAVAFGVLALTPAVAHADILGGPPQQHPHLTPRLEELSEAPLSTASSSTQAVAVSLDPTGPGSLMRRGGKLVVSVRYAARAAAHLDDLRAAGATVLDVDDQVATVTAAVDESDLVAVGDSPGVQSVTEVLTPFLNQVGSSTCTGAKTSEGDTQLNAATARSHFNVDGSGVTVGVMSDSFDKRASAPTHAAGDVATGDLPGPGNPCGHTTPVNVIDDSLAATSATDEGRAMTQIVHDLAPGATLAFATASVSETSFANNIAALVSAGAKVIVDDVVYFDEPFFQQGRIAQAVNTANAAGVSYFSSEGNFNQRDASGRDIGSFESPAFRLGNCGTIASSLNDCEDFDPTTGVDPTLGVTIPAGRRLTVILQWAEPWYGVTSNINLFLTDAGNATVLAGSGENNLSSQRPYEALQYTNNTGAPLSANVLLEKIDGTASAPRFKFIMDGISASEYPVSANGDTVGPTAFGHATATGASGVAAVRFDNSSIGEYFTSHGPQTDYFGPITSTSPAAALPTPRVDNPEIAATDGGANTFFGQQGYYGAGDTTWRFFGTSAAAPHAAAVAALQRQYRPNATPGQIRAAQASTAHGVGSEPVTTVGAGLIDADAAVGALTNTAVRWRGASARVRGRAVRIAWQTGYLPGQQLGFEILRERKSSTARVRVSGGLIPGGALGAVSGDYSWRDAHGHAGDRYFVVERTLRGGRRIHGPFVARR